MFLYYSLKIYTSKEDLVKTEGRSVEQKWGIKGKEEKERKKRGTKGTVE